MTNQDKAKVVATAVERVWEQIGMEIVTDNGSIKAAEVVELALDADRLHTFDCLEGHKAYKELIAEVGYDDTFQLIVKVMPYTQYECGSEY